MSRSTLVNVPSYLYFEEHIYLPQMMRKTGPCLVELFVSSGALQDLKDQ